MANPVDKAAPAQDALAEQMKDIFGDSDDEFDEVEAVGPLTEGVVGEDALAGAGAAGMIDDLPADLFGDLDASSDEELDTAAKKSKSKKRKRDREREEQSVVAIAAAAAGAPSSVGRSKGNAMDAALERIRQRKRSRTPVELPKEQVHEAADKLIRIMQDAHQADEESVAAQRPAVSKLTALPEVVQLIRHAALRDLLSEDDRLFSGIRDWLAPVAGSLPNLKIRQELLNSLLSCFPFVEPDILRKSGVGGVVNFLAKCPAEEPQNRAIARKIVEAWARPAEQMDYRRVTEEAEVRSEESNLTRRRREEIKLKRDRDARRAAGLSSHKVVGGAAADGAAGARPKSGFRARIPETTLMNFSRLPASEYDTEELKKRSAPKNAGNNPQFAKALNQMKRHAARR